MLKRLAVEQGRHPDFAAVFQGVLLGEEMAAGSHPPDCIEGQGLVIHFHALGSLAMHSDQFVTEKDRLFGANVLKVMHVPVKARGKQSQAKRV